MKRVLLALVLIFLMMAPDAFALGRYQRIITDIYGNIVAGASASVYAAGTTNLSTIYSDSGGTTPLANPLTSNATGRIQFYAADGTYDVTVSGTGIIAWTDSGVQLFDGVSKFTSNVLGPAYGGSGAVNNAASIQTISGSFPLTWTITASTGLTLPTTGTLSTLAGSETLTNKTITNPIMTYIYDSASKPWIVGSGLSNATDYFGIVNANTAAPVLELYAQGTDSNISMSFMPKGSTGYIGFGTMSPSYFIDSSGDINIASGKVYRINGTQLALANLGDTFTGTGNGVKATQPTLTTPIIASVKDVNGNVWIQSSPTASAVDYLQVTNAAAGNPALLVLGPAGSDSNINLELLPKGTGKVGILNASPGYALDVTGDMNISGTYRVNGAALALAGSSRISSLLDANGNIWLSNAIGVGDANLTINNTWAPYIGVTTSNASSDIGIVPKGNGTFTTTTGCTATSAYCTGNIFTTTVDHSSGTTANYDFVISRYESNVGSGKQYLTDWRLAGYTLYAITNKGHLLSDTANGTLSSPAASTCGTTPTVATYSTDTAGYVTLGSGSPTACTLTFANAYNLTPACNITPSASAKCYLSARSASALTVTCDATFVGFSYSCVGIGGTK